MEDMEEEREEEEEKKKKETEEKEKEILLSSLPSSQVKSGDRCCHGRLGTHLINRESLNRKKNKKKTTCVSLSYATPPKRSLTFSPTLFHSGTRL